MEKRKSAPLKENYHGVWIKYFTMPCKLTRNKKNNTPLDSFIQSFKYKPSNVDKISKILAESKTAEEEEERLCKYFQFDEFSLLNIIFFLRSVVESPGEVEKAVNKKCIKDYVARSFIILAYKLHKIVENEKNNTPDPTFPESCWFIIFNIYMSIISDDLIIKPDVFEMIRYFFNCFGSVEEILNLNDGNKIKQTLQNVLIFSVPFTKLELEYKSYNIYYCVNSSFKVWISMLENLENPDSCLQYADSYLSTMPPIVKEFQEKEKEDFLNFLIVQIIHVEESQKLPFDDKIKLLSDIADCISQITPTCISNYLEFDACFIGLINYIAGLDEFSLKYIPEECEFDPNNICSVENFKKTSVPDDIFTDFNFETTIKAIRKFVTFHPNVEAFFNDFISMTKDLDKEKFLKCCSIFLFALSKKSDIEIQKLSKMIQYFADIARENDNDTKEGKMLRTAFLKCLLSLAKSKKSIREGLYEILPLLFPKENFDHFCYFLPLFRSFIISDFINFLETNVFSFVSQATVKNNPSHFVFAQETIDKIASFIGSTVLLKPREILDQADSYQYLISTLFMKDRYKKALPLIFQTFFSLINTDNNMGRIIGKILNQSTMIYIQVVDDSSLIDVAEALTKVISDTTRNMIMDPYIFITKSNVTRVMCQICVSEHSEKMFNSILFMIHVLCKKFPSFIEYFNKSNTPVYSSLQNLTDIDVTKEDVELLKAILFNIEYTTDDNDDKYSGAKIENSGILKVLLNVIRDTKYEEEIYDFFTQLCKKNTIYSYQLFMANTIGIIMERLSQKVVRKALLLFTLISSSFFSPLTLRNVIKTIASTKDPDTRSIIVNALFSLTTDNSKLPMNSFFHFSGKETITSPKIYDLSPPFIVATTIRIDNNKERQPIFTIISKDNEFVYLYAENDNLMLNITTEKISKSYIIRVIRPRKWYFLSILFEQNKFVCLVGQESITIDINFPKFSDEVSIFLGSFEANFYSGDIGPFIILPAKNPEKAFRNAASALKTNSQPDHFIISYFPCNQICEVLMHASPYDDSACSLAYPIPFITSVADVLNYDSTFHLILPLFFLKQSVHNVIVLLQNIIHLSPDMSIYFDDIGGFHLLSSILVNIPNESMDEEIVNDLCIMFEQSNEKEKVEMVDSIFLNYPLWQSKPFSLQKFLFEKALPELIKQNRKSFGDVNTDILLYKTVDESIIEPYKFDFPERAECTPATLTKEQKEEINKYQWSIFLDLQQIHKMTSTVLYLFLVAVYHEDENMRISALKTFEKTISNGTLSAFSLISNLNPFDILVDVFFKGNASVKKICFRCICSLGITSNSPEVKKQLIKSIEELTLLTNKENADLEVFHTAIALAFGKNNYTDSFVKSTTPLFIPELLFYIFSVSKYFDDKSYIQKISNAIIKDPNLIIPLKGIKNWFVEFLDYTRRTEMSPQDFSCFLIEQMNDNEPYEEIFNYFNMDDVHEIIQTLVSFALYITDNGMFSLNVAKLICVLSTIDYETKPCLLAMDMMQAILLENKITTFSIFGKEMTIFHAYTNLVGILLKHEEDKEQIENKVNEFMKSYSDNSLNMLNEPNMELFTVRKNKGKKRKEVKVPESKDENFEKIYKDFIDLYKKQINNTQLQTKKLLLLFIRNVRTDGGPWSIASKNVHWKYTTRTDSLGRPVFFTHNLNFDNHRKASAARDSTTIEMNDDDEMKLRKTTTLSALFKRDISKQKRIKSFPATCRKLSGFYNGDIYVYDDKIIFNGVRVSDAFGSPLPPEEIESDPVTKLIVIPYDSLCFAFRRFYMHHDCGCEIFTPNWKATLFYFKSKKQRDSFFKSISVCYNTIPVNDVDSIMKKFRKICNGNTQNCDSDELFKNTKFEEIWASGKMSNFVYLFLLNITSGRSFNDISQYPIYPWVVGNYSSETFNINDPAFYRDFSKPVGAFNEKRLEQLHAILQVMDDPFQRCLYRSNISNPSCVLGYLIRSEPFTSLHIKLQDGKFDHPNRLFYSVAAAWESVNNTNGDYRELIPQFFCTPYFLTNYNDLDLGFRKDNCKVDEVILPPWAKNAFDFIQKNSAALESSYTSEHLNEWIDLTFGAYQNSIEHNNVYHFFSYHESLYYNLDESQTMLLQNHCANFGCLPSKLFYSPHAKKVKSIPICLTPSPFPQINRGEKVVMLNRNCVLTTNGRFFYDNKNHIEEYHLNLYPSKDERFYVIKPYILLIFKKRNPFITIYSVTNNSVMGKIVHQSSVIDCVGIFGERYIVTGGSDCVLYLWRGTTFELVGTIQVHSAKIQCISCLKSSDICVSVDADDNVLVTSPSEKKVRNIFKMENCPENSVHKVTVTNNEQIVISSYSAVQSKSVVSIYNTIGEELSRFEFRYAVSTINSSLVNKSEVIILLTFSIKRTILLTEQPDGKQWLANEQLKELNNNIDTDYISVNGDTRKIIYLVTNAKSGTSEIKSLLF